MEMVRLKLSWLELDLRNPDGLALDQAFKGSLRVRGGEVKVLESVSGLKEGLYI